MFLLRLCLSESIYVPVSQKITTKTTTILVPDPLQGRRRRIPPQVGKVREEERGPSQVRKKGGGGRGGGEGEARRGAWGGLGLKKGPGAVGPGAVESRCGGRQRRRRRWWWSWRERRRRRISFVFYMQKEIARCVFGASRIHRCCKNATY
jgi:hypothetical protein